MIRGGSLSRLGVTSFLTYWQIDAFFLLDTEGRGIALISGMAAQIVSDLTGLNDTFGNIASALIRIQALEESRPRSSGVGLLTDEDQKMRPSFESVRKHHLDDADAQ